MGSGGHRHDLFMSGKSGLLEEEGLSQLSKTVCYEEYSMTKLYLVC